MAPHALRELKGLRDGLLLRGRRGLAAFRVVLRARLLRRWNCEEFGSMPLTMIWPALFGSGKLGSPWLRMHSENWRLPPAMANVACCGPPPPPAVEMLPPPPPPPAVGVLAVGAVLDMLEPTLATPGVNGRGRSTAAGRSEQADPDESECEPRPSPRSPSAGRRSMDGLINAFGVLVATITPR